MNIEDYIKDNKLSIIVKPNCSKNEITGCDEPRSALRVNIKEAGENNKANIEVVKFFSKLLKREVKIVSGKRSKIKVLKINMP